jgi:uncharacterized repeat protein (TIGR01451 family)
MFKLHKLLLFTVCLAGLCVPLASGPLPAFASVVGAPQWTATAFSVPTNISPVAGTKGEYLVRVQNTGGAPSNGSTVTITDALPAGLKASREPTGADVLMGTKVSCMGLSCTYAGNVAIDDVLELKIPVEVVEGAQQGTQTNLVTVSGGGAPELVRETPTTISSTPASFGIASGSTATALSTSQAGGHPDLTATLAFTTLADLLVPGDPNDSGLVLPPGFVGDLADTPKCPVATFTETPLGGGAFAIHCPLSTQVGVGRITLGAGQRASTTTVPIYNLGTNPGEIAKLGFNDVYSFQGTVSLEPGKYGVRTVFQHATNNVYQLTGASLTIWGVPADPIHDAMRGLVCSGPGQCRFNAPLTHEGPEINPPDETLVGYPVGYPAEDQPQLSGQRSTSPPVPYLTSPTQCTSQPLEATFEVTSWQDPSVVGKAGSSVGPFTSCSLLEFAPAITASPDTARSDTPAGFTFQVKMGQEGLLNESANSESDVQDTTVTLPEGVAVNPGQASGLGACQFSQDAVGEEGPPSCPANSKVGQVEVETPVLRNKLTGNVYLLQSNPPELELLVAPEDPQDGIYVKLIGDVHLEPSGQIVTTFKETPQLPFSDFRLSFSGGAQAALVTPLECGTYTTTTNFTPWSSPFVANAEPSGAFVIETGPGGAPCPSSPAPFAPALTAGATTDQAGGFTDFSLLLTREDGQQRIGSLQFKTPKGLLGEISKVSLCDEPQASQGTCSAPSQIGHTVVEAGPGPYPLVVPQPGKAPAPIYLTGPYDGAPFGLSIVVPLEVGPFVLQTQVVRAKIQVDPHTSQLTITTGALPSIVDGIPSDLRDIDAVIDRPEFMINPTDCEPAAFSGTATSTEGATAPLVSRFQVGSCRALQFKPQFKVSTSGRTTREHGASLYTKLTYPSSTPGTYANIAQVKVQLPKELPSRLSTLQKACPAATFEANPAACPADSRVGMASAITPILPVPLTGPAYFVSHGGEAFPDLIVVLQGYGVTVDLVGSTFINEKTSITTSTFKTVPDVPVGTFELTLPQGPYSALAAHGNLCKSKLAMPTEFVAQDGAVITQSTPIAVTGCPKAKKAKKSKHAKQARHHSRRRKRAKKRG